MQIYTHFGRRSKSRERKIVIESGNIIAKYKKYNDISWLAGWQAADSTLEEQTHLVAASALTAANKKHLFRSKLIIYIRYSHTFPPAPFIFYFFFHNQQASGWWFD